MISIGSAEAKAKLSALLERAAAGEEIIITRRGKASCRLVPMALAVPSVQAHDGFGKAVEINFIPVNTAQAPRNAKPSHPNTSKGILAPQAPGLTWAEIIKSSRG